MLNCLTFCGPTAELLCFVALHVPYEAPRLSDAITLENDFHVVLAHQQNLKS